jgi:hypothetical protein
MSEKNPRVNDPAMLQFRFYQGFDPDLLFNRARAIEFALSSTQAFADHWKSHPAWSAELEDKDLRALASDLHFLEVHQSEVMFAMLCAPFQSLPHWLYLTTYRNAELTTKIEDFKAGRWEKLTNGKIATGPKFVSQAVYTGVHSELSSRPEAWQENCDNVIWLLQRMASRHLDNRADNNAYKHGLRVLPEHQVSLTVAPDNKPSDKGAVFSYNQGLAFLSVDRDRDQVSLLTKEINPNLSLNYLFIMRQIVANCRNTRLAALQKKDGCQIHTFLGIDREGITRATPASRFAITV